MVGRAMAMSMLGGAVLGEVRSGRPLFEMIVVMFGEDGTVENCERRVRRGVRKWRKQQGEDRRQDGGRLMPIVSTSSQH